MNNQLRFALDIGTRSVVGLVGEQTATGIEIIAYARREHHTRAMVDGQIHDVQQVAQVIGDIKAELEKICGPLKQVGVAAAGRSLYTMRSTAQIDAVSRGLLTQVDERNLELAAVQAAQQQLATSNSVEDPTSYYCVGYSTMGYYLDGTRLTSLAGQRGKTAAIELITTFLPRQVIDSMQSSLQNAGLEMSTLTLEPIAAINVLIPPTMRHLNLALVDIGAGTSDVAITHGGSVVAYGMAPSAGDEITEAISNHYLLDFNVAETVKRQLMGKPKTIAFHDILGATRQVSSEEIVTAIAANIAELARIIAAQIMALNTAAPQAVILVGGGALTPMLPEAVADVLGLPVDRVGIRRLETVDGIAGIPPELSAPDGVTPLGILKLSGSNILNFVNVIVNDQPLKLFNLGNLTVADAMLAAGIDVRTLHGRAGLGFAVTVNGITQFLPGTLGQPGQIELNGLPAEFSTILQEGDSLKVAGGADGKSPSVRLDEIVDIPKAFSVSINQCAHTIYPILTVNGQPVVPEQLIQDRSDVTCRLPKTLAEVLTAAGVSLNPLTYRYMMNGYEREFLLRPEYQVDRLPANELTPVKPDAEISVIPPAAPMLLHVLGIDAATEETVSVSFNDSPCLLPVRRYSLNLDGHPAQLFDLAPDGSRIDYTVFEAPPTVSDVLAAADFHTQSLPPCSLTTLLLNGQPTEFTAIVKNGDKVDLIIR
ncbi:cell division protein FtsA [Acetonema longum]|uniref:SHS2 domain-containing protein n=1 Tax=Acetonema longum DSM 6540 TaxID=1009370 RepID=F7NFL3_9FIRM|nr:cell division FtsA domain-containing protein [Acetonema longum]EGO65176.1 hypothetical protein ALO_04211 [Acetonema longum DSM 6540]